MADQSPTSKKLLEKQQRRAAEEERRREQQKVARKRNMVTLVIAVVVLGVVIALVLQNRGSDDAVLAGSVSAREAGCTEIEEHEIEGQEHVDATPQYGTNPPTSGNHYATPAAVGFYEEPLDPGGVLHTLEHSVIVFWYDPGAPQTVIDGIEALVDQEPQASMAIPWADAESPYTFAITAWGASQKCRQPSQAVVDEFREKYQGKGPEPVAPPFEG